MLYEAMMKDECVLMEKVRVRDELGTWKTQWQEGLTFRASIHKEDTLPAVTAEKQGVTEVYLITTAPENPLEYHDVFKRLSDGQIFRVSGNTKDNISPEFSAINFGQVRAERWELTA